MMGSSLYSRDLWITLACILTILLTSVGSSITWYEPPPIQTLSDTEDHLANSTQLLQGTINASLSWNFSLSSGFNFDSLALQFNGTTIAGVLSSGPGVVPGFGNQFNIRWIPSQIFTLIIFNATTEVNGAFSCIVSSKKGFDSPKFTSKIQVNVVDPPSNIVTSNNITVTAPANLTLNCSADGRPKPTPIWTRLSDNKVVPMPLNIIGEQDAGGYRCTAANGVGSALTKDVFITVLVPPKVDYLTSDWDECENTTLILSCNATGKPTPNITWRRVASDGTVIEKLPAVHGVYVLNNTNGNSSGQYRCTASNGVGIANKTVNVTVRFAASVDRIINSSNTVNEGGFFNMTCQASENPLRTNYNWINKAGPLFNESVLGFNNISRAEAGQYRCEVENRCGMDGRNTTVTVYYPPIITSISLNQTVVEGDVVPLNCTPDGNPDANITWTRLSDNSTVSMPLTITGKQDEGGYRCTADNGIGNVAFSDVFITIQYPPNITFISDNQMVNESDVVQLDCIADGNPQPKITWTRLSDNSTVSMPLTITGKQDEGDYRCTADNGVENATFSDVFISVQSYSPINVVFSTNLSKDTVDLNDIFNLTCSADANPAAKYRLYRDQANLVNITDGQSSGTFLTSVNNRVKQVTYRCIPFNSFRDGPTKTINVTVYYNPANVTLVPNTTENKDCSNLLQVKFTCNTSEANPPVENYQLLKREKILETTSNWTWVEDISELDESNHIYSCRALHQLGNVSSSNVTITFNVPASVTFVNKSIEVEEGTDVTLVCIGFGWPAPSISWFNKFNQVMENKSKWQLYNIGRNTRGQYNCSASNSCGNDSKEVNIDVKYKPENVSLHTSRNKVCAGKMVVLTCFAGAANPVVEKYTLYENSIGLVNISENVGVFYQMLYTNGQLNYSCNANNSFGQGTSNNAIVEVEVPASVTLLNETVVVEEGENVTVDCISAGFPSPNVSWVNASNYVMETGRYLRFPIISRHLRGVYNCSASNTCGSNSKKLDIIVHYPTETTGVGENYTVTEGSMELSCPVDGNPDPGVTWYKGREATGPEFASGKLLKVTQSGCYTCSASNDLGTPVSITHCLTLNFVAGKPTSAMPTSTGQPIKEGPPWTIIGAVAGSVVLVAFVVALVTWWVHKKRKCIKDTKIHNSECEESLHGYSPHASVNRAYAESGPPSANGSKGAAQEQSQDPGAIPTYAVVDKSKKKKKAEEKPPIYATVDKSKKRKKKKTDDKNLYDSVEEPKKEKKPGEVLYAELGDFQNPAMPEVSTSPATLPPLKRPPSYEQTQYADITAFLKGDATLPQKEGNEGSEMQQQSANQSQHDVDNKETPM